MGTPPFSGFQQSARVCAKQRFQPVISTFPHFRQRAQYFLVIFSKMHEFVHFAQKFSSQNRSFQPDSARFVIFAVG